MNWVKLVTEDEFRDAFDKSRWYAYAVVFQDFSVITSNYLRQTAGLDAARATHTVVTLAEGIFLNLPCPCEDRQFWDRELQSLKIRLRQNEAVEPQAPHLVAMHSGEKLVDIVPIHQSVRQNDSELIQNNVRFTIARIAADLRENMDMEALCADIKSQIP